MAGRYAFSLPSPQHRDGWFRIGQLDITTTVAVTALGVASMFLYAISKVTLVKGVFVPELVRDGEVWRLALWPLVNPPTDLWMIVGLAFFWYFGRFVEEDMGRKPFTVLVVVATILPAAIVTLVNASNDPDLLNPGRWSTATYSVDLLGLAFLAVFTTSHPGARFLFNIPGWVIALVAVSLRVLVAVGDRMWATLLMLALVLGITVFGAAQRGLCSELSFIPRLRVFAGTPGQGGGGGRRRRGGRAGRGRGGRVVEGPWQGSGRGAAASAMPAPGAARPDGLSRLEQAELDTLLDLIAEHGIDSLNAGERARLNELSRRLRGD